MKLSELRKLRSQLQNVDMDAIKELQAKIEQDVAYATYDHNIFVSGFIAGVQWLHEYEQ